MYKKIILFIITLLLGTFSYAESINNIISHFAKKNHIKNMRVALVKNQHIMIAGVGQQNHYAINSMTKSFTGLLLAYNVIDGKVTLGTKVKEVLPVFSHYPIGNIQLLNLATHTSGLPFKPMPDHPHTIHYLQNWQPTFAVGTRRLYSNNNIALLGMALSAVSHESYPYLLQRDALVPFSMFQSSINPRFILDLPRKSVFIAADGIVSTAHDMAIFMQNLCGEKSVTPQMHKAIKLALTGYYQTPHFIEGLSWQEYKWPIEENSFIQLASLKILIDSPAKIIKGTDPHYQDKLILRTGLGHGYSSIIAFIPEKKIGVVVLIHHEVGSQLRYELVYQLMQRLRVLS